MRKFQNILSLSPNQCGPLGDTKTTFFTEFSRSNSEKLIQNLISLETEQKQGRKQVQFIAVEALFTCLFLFDYKPVLVCVKDRTCLRIAILLLLQHFWINFQCFVLLTY